MAMDEIWMPSPCCTASRGPYEKVVLHLTVGAQTIEALGSFFANAANQVSSHFGIDNYQRGVVGAYVREDYKAWTQGNANPYCLSNELCTPAGAENWTEDYWLSEQDTLLRNAADWVAWMCSKYGIPVVSLSASQAQTIGVKGVCDHVDFGAWGGGHVDCGPGFPMDKIIEWAKAGTGGGAPAQDGGDMTAAVCYWQERPYMACVGTDNRPYYRGPDYPPGRWDMIDEDANWRSGATIAASEDGKLMVAGVNTAGHVVTYHKDPGGSAWTWTDRGGNAR